MPETFPHARANTHEKSSLLVATLPRRRLIRLADQEAGKTSNPFLQLLVAVRALPASHCKKTMRKKRDTRRQLIRGLTHQPILQPALEPLLFPEAILSFGCVKVIEHIDGSIRHMSACIGAEPPGQDRFLPVGASIGVIRVRNVSGNPVIGKLHHKGMRRL